MSGRDHYRGVPEPPPIDVDVNSIGDGAHLDAFARQRFSQPFTLFDSTMTHSDHPWLWSAVNTPGTTAVWDKNRASVLLSVGTASGDKIYRQSKQYMHYQPGKSQLVMMSGVLSAPKTGLTQRVGYFDDENGLFFTLYESELRVSVRSYVTGSPVDVDTPQRLWNMDRLDGTGPSRIKVNPAKVQIFLIDFEWLGSGRIRFGFVVDGEIRYCHEINNANYIDSVFMSDPAQPVRYEIENHGTTSSPSSLEQICSTVVIEGGYNPKGIFRSADMGAAGRLILPGNRYALVSVRLNPASLKSLLEPLTYEVLSLTNDDVRVEVILNGTLLGPTNFNAVDETGMEYDIASTTVSGGERIWSAYTNNNAGGNLTNLQFVESMVKLSATASGVPDVLTLAATKVGATGNATVIGCMNVKEII